MIWIIILASIYLAETVQSTAVFDEWHFNFDQLVDNQDYNDRQRRLMSRLVDLDDDYLVGDYNDIESNAIVSSVFGSAKSICTDVLPVIFHSVCVEYDDRKGISLKYKKNEYMNELEHDFNGYYTDSVSKTNAAKVQTIYLFDVFIHRTYNKKGGKFVIF